MLTSHPQRFHIRSDVFGFGVMLWALTNGTKPWPDLPAVDAARRHVNSERLSHPGGPLTDVGLWRVMQRCWAHIPAERPSMAEVRDELTTRLGDMSQAPAAVAQSPPLPPAKVAAARGGQQRDALSVHAVLALDINGDGIVDADELLAADADGDGTISAAELHDLISKASTLHPAHSAAIGGTLQPQAVERAVGGKEDEKEQVARKEDNSGNDDDGDNDDGDDDGDYEDYGVWQPGVAAGQEGDLRQRAERAEGQLATKDAELAAKGAENAALAAEIARLRELLIVAARATAAPPPPP